MGNSVPQPEWSPLKCPQARAASGCCVGQQETESGWKRRSNWRAGQRTEDREFKVKRKCSNFIQFVIGNF